MRSRPILLSEEQRELRARLETLLSHEDPDVVAQGAELAFTLDDEDLLDVLGEGTDMSEEGALAFGPSLQSIAQIPLQTQIALRFVLYLAARGRRSAPTRLVLEYGVAGEDCVRLIAESDAVRSITELDLRYNDLGDEGAEMLARAEHLDGLTTLHLQHNLIGPVGAIALAESALLQGVRALDLRYNPIGVRGASALAHSEHTRELRRLDLRFEDIGVEGAQALARSPYLHTDLRRWWRARASEALRRAPEDRPEKNETEPDP